MGGAGQDRATAASGCVRERPTLMYFGVLGARRAEAASAEESKASTQSILHRGSVRFP